MHKPLNNEELALGASIETMLREYYQIHNEIKALEEQKRILAGSIMPTALTAGGKLEAGEFCASVAQCVGPRSFDFEAGIRALGEKILEPFIRQGKPYGRLTVKKV